MDYLAKSQQIMESPHGRIEATARRLGDYFHPRPELAPFLLLGTTSQLDPRRTKLQTVRPNNRSFVPKTDIVYQWHQLPAEATPMEADMAKSGC
jgi:hypothetical protein